MSFDWKEFFHFAENIVVSKEPAPNEAQCRSAVSRAYYSVFHIATKYIEETGGFVVRINQDPTKSDSSHRDVLNELKSKKANRKIANLWLKMIQLIDYRQEADYKVIMHQGPKGQRAPVNNVTSHAIAAVNDARIALRMLDQLFEDLQNQP